MKTLAKTLLITSIILLAASFTGPGSEFLWGFLKPLSALLFVNFFIMNLLAAEYTTYDQERKLRLALAKQIAPERPTPATVRRPATRQPAFAH